MAALLPVARILTVLPRDKTAGSDREFVSSYSNLWCRMQDKKEKQRGGGRGGLGEWTKAG